MYYLEDIEAKKEMHNACVRVVKSANLRDLFNKYSFWLESTSAKERKETRTIRISFSQPSFVLN